MRTIIKKIRLSSLICWELLARFIRMLGIAIELQLFLNIVSLIIIAHWGLPLSYIAPLSNIIFSPFLSIFLLLSSLIFFSELILLPNEWLIYLLEIVTSLWSRVMALADRSCCFSMSKPSTIFTICAAVATCILLQAKPLKSRIARISSFALLLGTLLVYLGYSQIPKQEIQTVSLGNKSLTIVYCQTSISIIDHGAFGNIACTKGWLEFTLLPLLRQTYATDTITHAVLLKPTVKTLMILCELCDLTEIKHSYLPYWKGTTPRNLARTYVMTRDKIQKQGKLYRLDDKKRKIELGHQSYLELIPLPEQMSYKTITFANITINCILSGITKPLAQV